MQTTTEDLGLSGLAEGEAGNGPQALLVLFTPDAALRGATIPLDRPLTLGRKDGTDLDLGIDDPRVSRRHATVRPRGDRTGIELDEHGSRNGIFVDGKRSTGGLVRASSVLRLGDTVLAVGFAPARRPTRQPSAAVGASARLLDALCSCEDAAQSDIPVLLLGETGTGKEILARAVHELSGRAGAFVTLNCAAIPKELLESYLFGHQKGAFTGANADRLGYFAQAERGTLFLDEIGELLPDLQAKLLRVLEGREYSPVGSNVLQRSTARVVAATNVDLRREADLGTFRRDLYARIAGAVIRLAPLRERREDILPLARFFLASFAPGIEHTFTANCAELLVTRPWPMNIRELRTAMQRLALHAKGKRELRSADLAPLLDEPVPQAPAVPTPAAGELVEGSPSRGELAALLERHKGNVTLIARHYGKDRKQVYRWLQHHGLDGGDFR